VWHAQRSHLEIEGTAHEKKHLPCVRSGNAAKKGRENLLRGMSIRVKPI